MPKAVIVSNSRSASVIRRLATKLKILKYDVTNNEKNILYRMKTDGCLYPSSTTARQLVTYLLDLEPKSDDVVVYYHDMSMDAEFIKHVFGVAKGFNLTILDEQTLDARIINQTIANWEDQNAEVPVQIPGTSDDGGQNADDVEGRNCSHQ